MTSQTDNGGGHWQLAGTVIPLVVLALAGLAMRTPLASAYPLAALLLFLWVVADTLMLSMMARSSGKPAWSAVLGVLAGASLTVCLGSPPAVRSALLDTPALALLMATVVLAHVAWATARAHRAAFTQGVDRQQRWIAAASEVLPSALVRLAAAEVAVLHMALFRWGGPADVPADARPFSYHKHLTPMCAALLILAAIEVAVYHLLIGHWSRTAAIIMFVLSDLGFVYLLGLIKSFRFRPVLLTTEGVRVRAGFLIDQSVPLDAIVAVDGDFAGEEVRHPATLNAALLAWPNIMLRLERPLSRRSFLRKREPFDRIAFRLDDPEAFVRLLVWRMGRGAE